MQEVFEKIKKKLEEQLKQYDMRIERRNSDCYFDEASKKENLDGRASGIEKAIEIVDQVAEEYNNGWISCSERLPIGEEYRKKIDDSYFYKHMLTTTNEEDIPICVGWYDQENEVWYDITGFAFYPNAWQPLPAPPKKEV